MTDVRWNCLDPSDEHSALIVPREDLRALEAERDRLREDYRRELYEQAKLKSKAWAEVERLREEREGFMEEINRIETELQAALRDVTYWRSEADAMEAKLNRANALAGHERQERTDGT